MKHKSIGTLKAMTREQLDYAVFHQPNRFMLDYVQRKCKLQQVPFYNNIEMVGNTVSCSIPLALAELLSRPEAAALRHVLLAGFGVGLSWGGCLADLSHAWRPVPDGKGRQDDAD